MRRWFTISHTSIVLPSALRLLANTCAERYWHGGRSRTLVTTQMSLLTATSRTSTFGHSEPHADVTLRMSRHYTIITHGRYALHVWARTWDASWPVGRPSNSAEQVTPARRSIIRPTRHCDAGKSRRVTKISHQYYSRTHTKKQNDMKGVRRGSMLSRGNGLAITVWFTFPLSSPLEPAWQLWPPWWAPGWIIYIADGLWRRVVWYNGADVSEKLSGYTFTKIHGVTSHKTEPFKSNFGSC